MKILITGSNGFIAKNLIQFLKEQNEIQVLCINRTSSEDELENGVLSADWIVHLAGVNRPQNDAEFMTGNGKFTEKIVNILQKEGKKTPIILSSSIQVEYDNLYGKSKQASEQALLNLKATNGNEIYICRLANVFGKWAKPNYNSAVATFCHNIARDLPIEIHNPEALIRLVYIDDVINTFWEIILGNKEFNEIFYIENEYQITVGNLANILHNFKSQRNTLEVDSVGNGLIRALYSTYLSFFPTQSFDYQLPKYEDQRGSFVEMLKTKDSGQFSYFTAHPGITRGGHYHHTKNEKFLVIKGKALFKFKNIVTNEFYQLEVNGGDARVVETVPGWSHDITNIGNDELIVMLWANEIFDRNKPDTYTYPLTL